MWEKLLVADFNCVDDSEGTRGLTISVGPSSFVTLIFDKSIPHKQTDELRDLLRKMKLKEVIVELP